MSLGKPIRCVVISVEGPTPGPASGITYTVRWNEPGGGVTPPVPGCVPSGARWPDFINTDGAAWVGRNVPGVVLPDGRIQLDFTELPHAVECTGGGDSPGPARPGVPGQRTPGIPADPTDPTSPVQVGTGTIGSGQ